MFSCLCLADLHVGRPFVHSEKALRHAVDYAVQKAVDAVLIAGDLIDAEGDYFEAFALFEKEIGRLVDNKIRVVLVLGNHDYWLADKIEGLFLEEEVSLLGKKGQWSSIDLVKDGKILRIEGWSFSARHQMASPLLTLPASFLSAGTVALGLLHADYECKSTYAPITKAELTGTPHAAWILGHQHIPRKVSHDVKAYYPGSLQGLDITETGNHGALLLKIKEDGSVQEEWLFFAPLVFTRLEVHLDAQTTWHKQIYEAIEKLAKNLHHDLLEDVYIELVLTGKRGDYREIDSLEDKTCLRHLQGVNYWLYRKENKVRPCHDVEKLALCKNLVGATAKCHLQPSEDLVKDALSYCQHAVENSAFHEEDLLIDKESMQELIRHTSMIMLDSLLEKKS